VQDMIRKQQPMLGNEPSAVSTAPVKQLIDSIDSSIAMLAEEIASVNQLMSQTRAANVAAEPTLMLQEATERMRAKVLSLQGDVAMIRQAHNNILAVNPMVPMGMGQGNDPMQASSMQQPPMNMPPGMGEGQ